MKKSQFQSLAWLQISGGILLFIGGMNGIFSPQQKENWVAPAELGILLVLIGLICILRARSLG